MFAAFAGILYGYDTGTISGIQTMEYWKQEFDNPSEDKISLIVSILSVLPSLHDVPFVDAHKRC